MSKAAEAFRTISEVADELEIPKHVLRFWEQKFPQIRPMKRGGGRRYYRPEDLELLRGIRRLLHLEGYTIRGVQKILRTQGVDEVKKGRTDRTSDPPLPGAMEAAAAPRAKRQRAKPGPAERASSAPVRAEQRLPAEIRRSLQIALVELEACRALLTTSD